MARIKKDNFHGGYRITGLENDIAQAVKNRQFQQDMGRIGNQLVDAPADAFTGAVRTTAGMVVGGAAIGVGMARNRRFRYIMQAILHFPMAFLVVFFFAFTKSALALDTSTMTNSEAGAANLAILGSAALIALIVGTLWTLAYVLLRTRPKLKRLRQY